MKHEARARVAGEADLIRKYSAEFERLLKANDRNGAILALVDRHKIEYGELVKAHRERFSTAGTAA